ncbi:NrsF family protein [Sphingomicrobium lutaoense]|uniref:DUF1109 domain-containing protein n=1 Tax=Sphingomicrobium lutaoense TaxID=515949 RepID=A0A839Z026_9SPHN|nr:NrsF family protein [Sphingomicrobium lutaoense]MBB3764050.1 hypothetical protein [Sphingomicrobium lutaoense]
MKSEHLIDRLVEEHDATSPMTMAQGRLAAGVAALGSVIVILWLSGLRLDIAAGRPSPLVLLSAGLFGLGALASGWAATRLAQPAVGGSQGGALWMVGAIGLLPAISLIEYLLGNHAPTSTGAALRCLSFGLGASIVTFAVLGLRLRRGAPVLPERAGLFAGLSAGSVGAFAVTLECNYDGLAHLTLGHVAIVAAMALAGRYGLARWIRW